MNCYHYYLDGCKGVGLRYSTRLHENKDSHQSDQYIYFWQIRLTLTEGRLIPTWVVNRIEIDSHKRRVESSLADRPDMIENGSMACIEKFKRARVYSEQRKQKEVGVPKSNNLLYYHFQHRNRHRHQHRQNNPYNQKKSIVLRTRWCAVLLLLYHITMQLQTNYYIYIYIYIYICSRPISHYLWSYLWEKWFTNKCVYISLCM